ncbi:hypothetical protein INP83_15600 [Mucilaginibacter sp. 21P]|uniref:hypothetical protein n=1 Tax=Mucilaginibacter sp. 21P TaxID=2778902 RepID=UPI001C59F4F1|nr:hypothetical protein [Mucilaginibacter sp. 21P]QXV64507.1 hypothetical protein INP83_15600 [Mucilaginibacter sp. 21P]
MKSVFVINDNSVEARSVAEAALMFAKSINAGLLIGSKVIRSESVELSLVSGTEDDEHHIDEHLFHYLNVLNQYTEGDETLIREVDITDLDSSSVASFINQNNITMVMVPADHELTSNAMAKQLDLQVVLNKISVPMLVLPANWSYKSIQRLTYITDLRWCRTDVLGYLSKLTHPNKTELFIGHVAASGIPDMSTDFAKQVFFEVAKGCGNYERLNFHHIKSNDIATVADVLVHAMKNDALVLINHSQHYSYFIGKKLSLNQPQLINVPLLLYPN